MSSNYWSKVLQERLGRRRVLTASGGGAVGAALLAACGSDSGDPTSDHSQLVAPRVNTTDKAVPGGIWVWHKVGSQKLDPISAGNAIAYNDIFLVYSTLVKWGFNTDNRIPDPAATITGDAAESWETSPDGLQVTFRIRPGLKFDRRPPTNGREMTAADIKYSWDRTVGKSPFIGDLLHSKNEAGPIDSVSFPDSQRVTFKLAFPYAGLTNELAHWYFFVVPTEAEDKFDLQQDMRGTGPFMLQKWEPSVKYEFRRNPDFYIKGRPFLDGMDKYYSEEYATNLAQFESKAVWSFSHSAASTRQEDILRVKRDHPEMDLFTPGKYGFPGGVFWTFSQREGDAFLDVRLRRALSMLIDRDLYIETIANVKGFRDAGLDVKTEWDSHLSTSNALDWMDPRDKDFGEGAKYFKYDPAEAKKLISAAGLTAPVDFGFRNEQQQFARQAELAAGMWDDGGIKLNRTAMNQNTTWLQAKSSGGQGFSGILYSICRGTSQESLLVDKYTPSGTDTISKKPIPEVTDMVFKIRAELDSKRRSAMVRQLQAKLAVLMPDIQLSEPRAAFALKWPWLKNYGIFSAAGFQPNDGASSARLPAEYWYDASAKK